MAKTETLKGSCLCGAVRYTARGESKRFYHCHCSRCRKVTGTGHASNLFVAGTLTWDEGAEQVKKFRLPGAKGFGNSFCGVCGSRVPAFNEKFGTVFIPAGSLDEEPEIGPQARIFTGSRSRWSCVESGSDLPEFPEYPG